MARALCTHAAPVARRELVESNRTRNRTRLPLHSPFPPSSSSISTSECVHAPVCKLALRGSARRPQSNRRTTCLCIAGNINIAIYARFNWPAALPPLRPSSSILATANLPTRFDVQVHSPQEGRSLSLSLSRRHGFASSPIYPRVLAPLKSTAFVDPPVFIRIFVVDRYLSFPALVELRSSPLIKFEETFESLVPALVVARNGTNATVWTGVLYFSNVLLPPKIVREWGRCRGQV